MKSRNEWIHYDDSMISIITATDLNSSRLVEVVVLQLQQCDNIAFQLLGECMSCNLHNINDKGKGVNMSAGIVLLNNTSAVIYSKTVICSIPQWNTCELKFIT